MGTMIDWFKVKNRQDAIAKTKSHVLKIYDCVIEAGKALTFFMEDKMEEGNAVVKRVNELEHDGDNIRRDLLKDLSRGELASTVREDLTHLVKRIDDVAGAANACAKFMALFTKPMWEKISLNFKDPLNKIMNHSGEAAKHLVEMVDDLAGERIFLADLGRDVNKHEHDVDTLHFEVKRALMNLELFTNPFQAISFVTMIDIMEMITDRCEEVADYIILIAIAAK